MKENQNIEYIKSWRDEYLEWICCYANSHGRTLYVDKDDACNRGGILTEEDSSDG